MKIQEPRKCPRCKTNYHSPPALSRRDNETNICPNCGQAEAKEDFGNTKYQGQPYWKPGEDDGTS